jgi:NADH dehydrogenase
MREGETPELDVVTGAFGYTGRYIARRLLSMGRCVRTLTGHPDRPDPFGGQVHVAPLDFAHPKQLTESLRGAGTLYNTYWVRFPDGRVTYDQAIENTKTLIRAAEEAGIRRVVHLSVANASEESPLPYFRGKALVEKAIVASRLSHAIVRPTVTFGLEDILLNNIAWLLRHVPVFAVPGRGEYRLQPVYVEDVAEITVTAGQQEGNRVIDAAGAEVYTFEELVRLIAGTIGRQVPIRHVAPKVSLFLARAVGWVVRDVVLSREEVEGLMANLLISAEPPRGKTRLSDWLRQEGARIGSRYASEMSRHYRGDVGRRPARDPAGALAHRSEQP